MEVTAREFQQRRKSLMSLMGEDSIAILPAAPVAVRNKDIDYPYRQDSDFYYLTGFMEPDSVLVLKPGRAHGEYVMFCRERDRDMEMWNGYMAGPEGACEDYGAEDAFPISDIDEILPGMIEGCGKVFYAMGSNTDFDRQLMEWVNVIRSKVRAGAQSPNEFMALDHLLHDMRLYKSKKEIQLMKRAGKISAEAHVAAMQVCKPGMMEYELEAVYVHHFMKNNCRSPAYPSIVGGGKNGCILHYIENNCPLEDGDMVLVDAGAEYRYYAGDITRTFPVNGNYSAEQRALYDLVLDSQLAAIDEVKPGNHWNAPHEAAVKVLTKGLVKLGLLQGRVPKLIKDGAYRPFYMHRTGHWIGIDVHDVGDYKVDEQWRELEPGMALTVEPGLYIAPNAKGVDKKWCGLAVRIEDDVVVTKHGCEVLTPQVPKDADEIEALMAG